MVHDVVFIVPHIVDILSVQILSKLLNPEKKYIFNKHDVNVWDRHRGSFFSVSLPRYPGDIMKSRTKFENIDLR